MKITPDDIDVGTVGLNNPKCLGCGKPIPAWADHTLQDCLEELVSQIEQLRNAISKPLMQEDK
jgi:predicted amidophosphoribosyltransferase